MPGPVTEPNGAANGAPLKTIKAAPGKVGFYSADNAVPLEMHKVRIVQKLSLLPLEARIAAMGDAGYNTFLLQNCDVFLDMLTDSGVNAMSDQQQAAMMVADDSYAGSSTYTRLSSKLVEVFGTRFFLPAHQGRACEHILCKLLLKPGQCVPMNFHFTTTKAHITVLGGVVEELVDEAGLEVTSDNPFKGNMDCARLEACIQKWTPEGIAFVRVEAGTNLIGGQPFSLQNLKDVRAVCDKYGCLLVMDASLLQDNLHFVKQREAACAGMSIREITRAMADQCDIIYFSGRKLGCGRGGGICMHSEKIYRDMRGFVPLYEGFLTYGGMSVREMEALAIGIEETMDEEVISQGPQFIAYMVDELLKRGIPVITPAGGLGVHVDAMRFVDHIPQTQYPAGALAAAIYITGGIRGMERGTLSEQREPDGTEPLANMELVRLALPRRVFTLSQVKYTVDRLQWLHAHRRLIGGLEWVEEPDILRFFYGRLAPIGNWQEKLAAQFKADFGEGL